MQEIFADLIQMVEKLPVVSMRVLPEIDGWRAAFVSRNVEDYGYAREDMLSGLLTWLDMVHPADRTRVCAETGKMLADENETFKITYRVLSPAGEETPVIAYIHAVRGRGDEINCLDLMIFKRNGDSGGGTGVREEVRRQMAINEILFSLNENQDYDPIMLILSKAGAYLGVSRVILQSQSEDENQCRSLHEWLNKGVRPTRKLDIEKLCGDSNKEIKAILEKNGLYVLSAGAVPEKTAAELREHGVMSAVVAPVQAGPGCRAVLCFEDLNTPHVWNENSLAFIKSVTALISSVLLRRNHSEKAPLSQSACETVLDNIGSFIFVTDPDGGEILFANRSFRNTFGENCLGRDHSEYINLSPALEIEARRPAGNDKTDSVGYETYLEKTGQWLAVTRDLVPWVDGINAHLHNCYDITFKKNYEESIKRLAYLDHLTGLPNRYRCDTDLRQLMSASCQKGKHNYILFIDLDDFKVINDSYGHHYGDGVLVSFSSFLQETYAVKHSVYRFGGDEFVLIIMDCDQDDISGHLNTILERAQKPWKSLNREFYCSLSIGVVEIPQGGFNPKSLIQRADIAMYEAKRTGKNSYTFYTEGQESSTMERSEMEWLLRESMENGFQGFEIHYQPYSRASDLKILGAEALVRMRDRKGNLLLPQAFMPLAEYLGFIVPLGEHILRLAALQCKAVNDAGLPDFSVTVNLSARQFKQQDIVERLEDILRSTGVTFSNIIVAVSEGVAIKELQHMLRICETFRRHGIRVALDDFGSGSSSLINMRDLPVDIIKVSSNYIDDYQDDYSGYFIRLAADLGHYSGKSVCLNGVEDEEHYRFCKELGLDMVQGFLFHRPDTAGALNSILRS